MKMTEDAKKKGLLVSLHLQVVMASQISKIKTEEGVEGGISRRPVSFGRMRGGLCSQMGSRKLFAKIYCLEYI